MGFSVPHVHGLECPSVSLLVPYLIIRMSKTNLHSLEYSQLKSRRLEKSFKEKKVHVHVGCYDDHSYAVRRWDPWT